MYICVWMFSTHFIPAVLYVCTHLCSSNSADKVVNGKGKFEELIVYSKDIAASTAQLVAASRVKARPRSEKLTALKGASKKGVLLGLLPMHSACLSVL